MTFSGPFEDRLAIRELVDCYANGVSHRDATIWGQTWAENALWCVPEFPGLERVEGRSDIVAAWSEAMTNYTFNFMIQSMGTVSVDGDTATGLVHNFEVGVGLDGNTTQHVGCYEDTYVKLDGQWLFASRIYTPRHNF